MQHELFDHTAPHPNRKHGHMERKPAVTAAVRTKDTGSSNSSGLNRGASQPTRGSVIAVAVDPYTFTLGTVGEKVAGGLFEVVLELDGAHVSGVFRLSEMMFPLTVNSAMVPGAVVADFGFGAPPRSE